MFEPSVYRSRRLALAGIMKDAGCRGILAFPGNAECGMNYRDNAYRFRQDSTFLYYFGISRPDLAGTIDLDSGAHVLYADDPDIDSIIWTGMLPSARETAALSGTDSSRPLRTFAESLKDAKAAGRKAHYLPPYRGDQESFLEHTLGDYLSPSVDFVRAVVSMREVKEEREISEIGKAVGITLSMHEAAMRSAKPGMTEAELAAIVTQKALEGGGDISFPLIGTCHGEILHSHDHSRVLEDGRMFLLDAGAETPSGYSGDLTSSFPVNGTFDSRQRDVYGIVLEAMLACAASLAPGRRNLETHLLAARIVARGLKDLGVMKGNADDAVAEGAHTAFFPHGIGHMMGLDVHDMEALGEDHVGYGGMARDTRFGFKSLRLAKGLKPGFVVTVEPGIYFIPALLDKLRSQGAYGDFIDWEAASRWRDFGGIRIEEDWLVTETGARVLGPAKPRTASEVEVAMRPD